MTMSGPEDWGIERVDADVKFSQDELVVAPPNCLRTGSRYHDVRTLVTGSTPTRTGSSEDSFHTGLQLFATIRNSSFASFPGLQREYLGPSLLKLSLYFIGSFLKVQAI